MPEKETGSQGYAKKALLTDKPNKRPDRILGASMHAAADSPDSLAAAELGLDYVESVSTLDLKNTDGYHLIEILLQNYSTIDIVNIVTDYEKRLKAIRERSIALEQRQVLISKEDENLTHKFLRITEEFNLPPDEVAAMRVVNKRKNEAFSKLNDHSGQSSEQIEEKYQRLGLVLAEYINSI